MDVAGSAKMAMSTVADSAGTFDEDGFGIQERPVPGYERSFRYIPFGIDDLLPYHLIHTIMGDEIMSQNLFSTPSPPMARGCAMSISSRAGLPGVSAMPTR